MRTLTRTRKLAAGIGLGSAVLLASQGVADARVGQGMAGVQDPAPNGYQTGNIPNGVWIGGILHPMPPLGDIDCCHLVGGRSGGDDVGAALFSQVTGERIYFNFNITADPQGAFPNQ